MKIKIKALLMAMAISLVSVSGVFAEDGFAPVEENPVVESENNEIAPLAAAGTMDEYAPTNMLLTPGTSTRTTIRLSWHNPAKSLTDVKLYDITTTETLLSDQLSTTSGATVYHVVTNVADNAVRQYKIVFSYSDSTPDRTYYLGGANTVHTGKEFGNFGMFRINTANAGAQPLPIDVTYDTETKRGQTGASMKIVSTADTTQLGAANIYGAVSKSVDFKGGKKYKLTYWAKWNTKNDTKGRMRNLFGNGSGTWPDGADNNIALSSDWRKFEMVYDNSNGGDYASGAQYGFGYVIDSVNGTVWLDDIKFVEIDAQGNEVANGEVLIDENFDTNIPTASAVTLSQNVTSPTIGVRDLTLTFGLSAAAGADFYVKENGNWSYMGQLASTFTTMKFQSIADGTYEYKIVPFGTSGTRDYEKAQTVTATVAAPAVEIGDVALLKDDGTGTFVAKTALEGAGDYKITVPVRNNSVAAGYTYTQVVAIYDGAKLVDVISASPAQALATTDGTVETPTAFTIDANADSVKVFLIDSNSTWEKIKDTEVFN